MAGTIIAPTAATVPGPEPEMAAKNVQARIVVMPRPPYMRPTSILATSMICRVILPYSISEPATTKQGMASSVKILMPSNSELWMTERGSMLSPSSKAAEEAIMSDMKMGMPKSMVTASVMRAISIVDIRHPPQSGSAGAVCPVSSV